MDNIKLILIGTLILLLSNCGLDKMAMDYNKVNFMHSPSILEVHGGDIKIDFKGTFPENYFEKKATLEITPVIINEDGKEVLLTPIILQGEQASGGEATIFYESGGDFSYSGEISYDSSMIASILELRAVAKLEDDSKVLGPVKIANGTIATSERVRNDEIIVFADHGYDDTTILSESATIYFLVNKSNIRTSEKSDADVQKLKEFIDKSYKTASFEIRSYASPEGSVSINDELSDDRNENTLKYAKYLLRKLKADASSDDTKYTTVSVGEDWDGFYNLVNQSSIDDKTIINRIVKSNKTPEQKEQAIRDMAEVYDAIDKNILPYLRKAEITILAYQPKRTIEEIISLATNNPDSLNVSELLYAATLIEDVNVKMSIYKHASSIYNDWRAYNNIAAMYLLEGDVENAKKAIDGVDVAEESMKDMSFDELFMSAIFKNIAVIGAWEGEDLQGLHGLYELISPSEVSVNEAILFIRTGNYKEAAEFFNSENHYNATLAKILNGDNNANCNEQTAACYYLNAIAGARLQDESKCLINLKKAINLDKNYKLEASKDLEFIDYRDNEEFKSLTK